MEFHSTWFKRWFNPVLRRLFRVEICSIFGGDGKVLGYGIRKYRPGFDIDISFNRLVFDPPKFAREVERVAFTHEMEPMTLGTFGERYDSVFHRMVRDRKTVLDDVRIGLCGDRSSVPGCPECAEPGELEEQGEADSGPAIRGKDACLGSNEQ